MMIIIKILPIYFLYRKGGTIHWINDIIALSIIYGLYYIYLFSLGTSPDAIYKETEKSLVSGDNKTPMFYLMDKIYSFFRQ